MAEEGDPIIVKADEVDEAGADISIISAEDATEFEFNARIESRRAHDAQPGGSPKILANEASSPPIPLLRPPISREVSAPPPPQQAPPPAPPQQPTDPANATDSLSLQQLRRLVTDLPKLEPTAYAYEYADTRSFPEEINEWFQYTEEERFILLRAKQTFDEEWEKAQATRAEPSDQALIYTELAPDAGNQSAFVSHCVNDLKSEDIAVRLKGLDCLSYITMGVWGNTAAQKLDHAGMQDEKRCLGIKSSDANFGKSRLQLHWMVDGVMMVCSQGSVPILVHILKSYYDKDEELDSTDNPSSRTDETNSLRFSQQVEINQTMTILYLITEVARFRGNEASSSSLNSGNSIMNVKYDLLLLLTEILAKLRWEESPLFPVPRVLLLFWKLILLHFGDSKRLSETKEMINEVKKAEEEERKDGIITTSPLDYHLFRQEITSKYPAYEPPPPLIPIEPENNSILPPLPNHSSRRASQDLQSADSGPAHGASTSIFYQPVHIATPAPSPPPSPAGPGGKVGKKQNYQTNQNLPFLYPPLDNTSNAIGGRDSAELQSKLVGKRWEGSDVPASIQEAGQLFASRMRMSRPLRQLWDVREEFMKQERGWDEEDEGFEKLEKSEKSEVIDEGDLLSSNSTNKLRKQEDSKDEVSEPSTPSLDLVEQYYVCYRLRDDR